MDSWAEIVKGEDFSAHASASEQGILVSLGGTADLTVKVHLDTFLHDVHSEAQRRLAQVVTVDLRKMDFMNSSCLRSLVWWISTVQEQPREAQYRITFLHNPSVRWQLRSLNSLARIASNIITIRA